MIAVGVPVESQSKDDEGTRERMFDVKDIKS
jgi:hypothetical protein